MDDVTNPFRLRRPSQFGLKSLFVVTALIAIVCGTFHWFGVLGGTAVIVVGLHASCAYLWRQHWERTPLLIGMMAILDVGLVVAVWPLLQPARTPSRRAMCSNNLKQIGIGLLTYSDVHGCLPPAYIADERGRPMHSWRVLILPFIEEKALYQQYRFDEPWDGPHNRLLANHMPPCYRCASDAPWPAVTTSYLAVTGAETAWPGSDRIALAQITDGDANTIALAEVSGSGVNWMEPRDLTLHAFCGSPPTGLKALSAHPNGTMVLFCDGHTSFLGNSTPPATLKALATRAGGETVVGDY